MKLKLAAAVAAFLAMTASSFAQAPASGSASNSDSASSWVAGGHVGYNWQNGPWLYGLEADLSGMHLKTDFNTVLPTGAFANTNSTVDWYGTVRGRLGWTTGPFLFYGTGGLSFGGIDLNSSLSGNAGRSLIAQSSTTRAGWVAGGGIDYMWRPDLILKLAYQYVDLGSISVAGSGSGLSESATAHGRFSVVTAGLSWHFAPGNSGPWSGFYAGGQVGGAWGNRTEGNYFDQPVSDARLKRDIVLVARLDDGLGIYRYRYLWSDTVYVGVMAQEVALLHPEAVVKGALDDYMRVDYRRLGLRLMTWQEWQASDVRNGSAPL